MATIEELNTITSILAFVSIALGLIGLISTALFATARSRARATAVRGTITVRTALPQDTPDDLRVRVVIKDPMRETVAKGTITSDALFEASLAPGLYKVFVNAPGHDEYMEIVKIAPEQTCAVTAHLNAVGAPVLNMSM